jgi:hypothetical protein
MTKSRFTLQTLSLFVLIFAASSLAQAQATRTWVSGVGDDVNPCSRTAPCKTFVGALTKTAANGEISVLDPGGYGAVNINKSITIDGTGTKASMTNAGSNGITINLGAGDVEKTVRLRSIDINGAGGGTKQGTRGIFVSSSNASPVNLIVDDVVIDNQINEGIFFNGPGGELVMRNTIIRNCGTKGIMLDSSTGAFINASITNTDVIRCQEGVRAETNVRATIRNSNISQNAFNGIVILTVGGAAEFNIVDSIVSSNKIWGITVDGSGGTAIARISNVTVVNNTGLGGAQGLRTANSGQILGAGNSIVDGNTVNGTVTGPVNLQ